MVDAGGDEAIRSQTFVAKGVRPMIAQPQAIETMVPTNGETAGLTPIGKLRPAPPPPKKT